MKYNVCMYRNRLRRHLIYSNRRIAKELWGNEIEQRHFRALRDLTERFGFSVARGDIQLLNRNWYVTHSGLLQLAYRNRSPAFGFSQFVNTATPGYTAGSSRQQFTNRPAHGAS